MGWGSWRGAGADGTIEIDVTGTGIVACGQECLQWDLGHVSGGEYVGCWVLQNTDLCRVGLLVVRLFKWLNQPMCGGLKTDLSPPFSDRDRACKWLSQPICASSSRQSTREPGAEDGMFDSDSASLSLGRPP